MGLYYEQMIHKGDQWLKLSKTTSTAIDVCLYNSAERGKLVWKSLEQTQIFKKMVERLMTYFIQPIICIELATVSILVIHMAANNTDRRRAIHTVL